MSKRSLHLPPADFPAETSDAARGLAACLASLDGVAIVLARLAASQAADAVSQHVRDSAAAALDGLRPEVEYLRRDVALLPPCPPDEGASQPSPSAPRSNVLQLPTAATLDAYLASINPLRHRLAA